MEQKTEKVQEKVKDKGLDLRQKPSEKASFTDRDGKVFFIPSDIPLALAQRYYEIDFDNYKSKDNQVSIDIMKEILCVENPRPDVEKLFKTILSRDFVYISNFVSEYMQEVNASKKKD